MKRIKICINLLLIFSSLCCFAQLEVRQRTEELEKLNVFAGKWKAEGRVYPGKEKPAVVTKGERTFEWVMRGTWLMFKSGDGKLQGHGYLTWDKKLAKYAFFWFDNLLTKPTVYHGNWLDANNFAVSGKLDFRGKMIYTKLKWQFINENEMNVIREVSSDGIKFRRAAEWKYTRGQ